jgi:hypothetical protein
MRGVRDVQVHKTWHTVHIGLYVSVRCATVCRREFAVWRVAARRRRGTAHHATSQVTPWHGVAQHVMSGYVTLHLHTFMMRHGVTW